MRTITIIYDGELYTFRWLKTLLWAKKQFKELGYKLEFPSLYYYLPLHKRNEDIIKLFESREFDIVLMAFHHSTTELGTATQKERAKVLSIVKSHCKKLIWMDTADSTGTCLFDVMPYVDIYMKKQILKDRSLYLNEYYGGCMVYQYYHDKYNLNDHLLTKKYQPAKKEDLSKMRVSWSIGMSDMFTNYHTAFLFPKTISLPVPSERNYDLRKFDVFYRGYAHSEIIGWQRHKCSDLLMSSNDIICPNAYESVSPKEYQKEFNNSRAVISPYGWGEVCFRDFEAFGNEVTLLKPDMSHCVTYPDVFIEGETYIPIDWDFYSFEEAIDELKANKQKYREIASHGRELYLSYLNGVNAKQKFAQHFFSQLESDE